VFELTQWHVLIYDFRSRGTAASLAQEERTMHVKQITVGLIAVALFVLPVSSVRSEMISWSYSANVVTESLDSTGRFAIIHPGIIHNEPNNSATWFEAHDRGIVFSGVGNTASGSATVPAFRVGVIVPATPNFVFDSFDPRYSTFTMNFRITDRASHASGTLVFPGYVSGFQDRDAGFTAYWGRWYGINVPPDPAHPYPNPSVPTIQSLTLSNHVYTVSILPFSYHQNGLPTPPDYSPTTPELAQVTVSPRDPNLMGTPEPSTLLLAAVGLVGAAPLLWRRRL
jgi:hypothetical protein